MIEGEEVRECLMEAGCTKVAVIMEEGDCVSLIVEVRGKRFLVAVHRGSAAYYAKVVPEELAHTSSCSTLAYYPHGLYAFSNSLRGLCQEIVTKASRMIGWVRER
ncbi:MAG: hypothetical protein GXO32_07400 [Crenarchaeota archaeon]|nr:hypothetical protein [Thermoproteota archaeon]